MVLRALQCLGILLGVLVSLMFLKQACGVCPVSEAASWATCSVSQPCGRVDTALTGSACTQTSTNAIERPQLVPFMLRACCHLMP